MIFFIKIAFIPLISALIGWATNKLAVWLLFNPKEPIKIVGITFHGVFPKRQHLIAQRIGDLVADELLSVESLKTKVFTHNNLEGIKNFIINKVELYFETDFKEEHWLMNLFVGESSKMKIKKTLEEKIDESMADLSENFHNYLEHKINIREIVSERIRSLNPEEVNHLMNQILKNELRFIEWTGAVLGFIIGLIQIGILSIV